MSVGPASRRGFFGSDARGAALIVVLLTLFTYGTAFDNGFHKDDYRLLNAADAVIADPGLLLIEPRPGSVAEPTPLGPIPLAALALSKSLFGTVPRLYLLVGAALHALVAWCVYLRPVGLRVVGGQHGDRPARSVVLGFAVLAFSYIGIRLLGGGA